MIIPSWWNSSHSTWGWEVLPSNRKKKEVSATGLPKRGLFNIHLFWKAPKIDTKTSSYILLSIFSPFLLPLPFPSPPLPSQNMSSEDSARISQFRRIWGKPRHVAHSTVKLCLLFERAFFSQIKPAKPEFLGKSLSFCYQVITCEKWSCSLLYFCHSAQFQDGRMRISSLEKAPVQV